jgi:hypothetical protein
MSLKTPDILAATRLTRQIERECERERHERMLHDEQRAGLAADVEFRLKDARENTGAVNLRRAAGRNSRE